MINMNLREIYVLNLALDQKNIFMLPDFGELNMSNLLVDAVSEVLVRKGLLESENTFTSEGMKITKRILDYKKATKYVKLGSLVIGYCNRENGVVLKRYQQDDYAFERIDLKDQFHQLCIAYPFLQQKSGKSPTSALPTQMQMTFSDVVQKYALTIDNCAYLSTFTVEKRHCTNEIIFSQSENLYVYDRDSQYLKQTTTLALHKLLQERMAI